MSLTTGTHLERYEIIGPLGAGGMGEVYRALDTKLGREVALKILPPKFAADPSRLARFEREARLLASLNHPNIAAIYGVEHANGIRFLVLELVDGPTLSERLKSGAIEVPEALRIAIGIAEALEAAHDNYVVHRDLKPGNVKITPAGKVKVLDFGLAKALGEAPDSQAALGGSNASTVTLGETEAGLVMGTAAYMSPEQAEAKLTDKRSDVWSFGVVLFEMLSGKRCFDGKITAHVMVHLLEDSPDWEKLPANMPWGLRNLLERCLQKDPAKRLRDVGDLRLQLEALAEETSTASKTARAVPPRAQAKRLLHWAWQSISGVAVVAALALALAFLYLPSRPPEPAEVTRFEIEPPANTVRDQFFTVSPDGRKLAFLVGGRVGKLWVRYLDSLESHPLPGTEDFRFGGVPIWSPDSRFIVFTSDGWLKKIEASGGPVEPLCAVPGILQGGFWTPDNRIVFGVNASSGLLQVSADGGTPTPVTTLAAGEIRHFSPALLPDGRHFVYATLNENVNSGSTYLGSLDAKPDQQQIKKVLSDRSRPAYVASANPGSKSGYLLFVRGSTLVAQAFNMGRLELAGEVQPIAENIAFDAFSTSTNGVLVYLAGGGALQQFTWFDKQGQPHGTAGQPFIGRFVLEPALSPDEKRLAFARQDPQSGNVDIWIHELARDVPTRFTTDPGLDVGPLWSPDGLSIVFTAQRNGVWGLYRKPSNLVGGEELLYKSEDGQPDYVTSWSRDRRYILFQKEVGNGVFALPMDEASGERTPIEVVPGEFNPRGARFLPDLDDAHPHYVSYCSRVSGQDEIYVRTFDPNPASGPKPQPVRVSIGGGLSMRWREDGKRLFYLASANGDMMTVDVTYSPKFHPEVPKRLFPSHSASIFWEMTRNGERFLIPIAQGQSASSSYTVVLNWTALLKK